MTKIVLLDKDTFPPNFNFKRPNFAHDWQDHSETKPEDTMDRLQGAEIAITNKVKITRQHIQAASDLKMIAIAATGYDHIDIEAARSHGVIVSNVQGYALHSVPEHTMALILALSKSLKGYTKDVQEGRWPTEKQFCFFSHPIESLYNKTLGIIGRGILGQGLARLASGFGMDIMYAGRKGDKSPHRPYCPFDEFLDQADIISIHCPLNEQTRDLITAKEFAKMAKRPILINTARGGIVNEQDAVTAIKTGQIRALGSDCLAKEPPTADNPLLQITHMPNVIITPHIAWASEDAITALWDQLVDNIEKFQKGNPQNMVQDKSLA